MPHSVHPTPRANTPNPAKPEEVPEQWWNFNQPKEKWTAECPAYLLDQSEKNMGILMKKDEDFTKFTWEKCQELVESNNIHHFQRSSSQLRGYLQYVYHLKKTHGSILSYIQLERLHWTSITPNGDAPFRNASDYLVLYNDWPYFVEDEIKHLVVWTKFLIDEDETTGRLTKDAEKQVEAFISETFCKGNPGMVVDREDIVWFKNWKSLKSVHALEHFHIMLFKPPEELLEAVTAGDRPTCESWKPSEI